MMSSKKSNTLRFAVGTPENIQSAIWIMKVHKDSVYMGAKNFMGVLKVSLHQSEASSVWRVAFVKELERDNPEKDRVILKWQRPGEFAPGWTPSVGILISSIDAEFPFKKVKVVDSRIRWFAPPEKGKKFLFKVLFSKPDFSESELKRVTVSGDRLVGKLLKKSGEIVWLVLRENELSFVEVSKIVDVMRKTKIHLKPGSSGDSIADSRALLVVSEDLPSVPNQPTILDIALGKENLDIQLPI